MSPDSTDTGKQTNNPGSGNFAVAVLEHLTGPSRGTVTWLGSSGVAVSLDDASRLHIAEIDSHVSAEGRVALLRQVDGGFEIETFPGQLIWVNGRPVEQKRLVNHDMIEFGNSGPISRFCLCASRQPIQNSFPGIMRDSFDYYRASRKSPANRLVHSALLTMRRALFETTYFFRIGVILVLFALGLFAYQQSRMNALVNERMARGDLTQQRISRTLSRNRDNAVTPAELDGLRRELGIRMETAVERLDALEQRSDASARVIRQSSESVIMIQSAYGFRDTATGRFLRQVLGKDGKPRVFANGLLMLSLDGDGPIAERQFIGTAFALQNRELLVTNRHVGYPWEQDALIAAASTEGLEPAMVKLSAYIPGRPEAAGAQVILASQEEDLALLRLESGTEMPAGLMLAETESIPGAEIIVLGYPTGLRSLLAQAGHNFIDQIQRSGESGFWNLAQRLARAGKIVPLASRGIVGRVNEDNLVYDAETTHGGSGGPVMNMDGKVVAVNTAVLPEYGGSNLGIPTNKIRNLLDSYNKQSAPNTPGSGPLN